MSAKHGKFAFFRQSGWMVIATFAGGICMLLVHTVGSHMPEEDYASFADLVKLMFLIGLPSSALQTIFAKQAAAAVSEKAEAHLTATTRALAGSTFLWGLFLATVILIEKEPLMRFLKINTPVPVYLMAFGQLIGYWIPMGKGLLQGKHHFAGLGWLQISDGVSRFGIMVVAVGFLHGGIRSAALAVAVGQILTVTITAWLTRSIWSKPSSGKFAWKEWIGPAIPLTLGFGTYLAMCSIDLPFVRDVLADTHQTNLYAAAQNAGFAITQFIAPVALVMFSRVAQNMARSERSDSFATTLMVTTLFGIAAALGCTVLPKLPLQVIYSTKREMWNAWPLVPWFAWALLPLTVANVLIQNILARGQFKAAPWLVAVPIVYVFCLHAQIPALLQMPAMDAFRRVVQTLAGASLTLCVIGAVFCRNQQEASASGPELATAPAASGKASAPPA